MTQSRKYLNKREQELLDRNSDCLIIPSHRRLVVMYSNELPISTIEQVTKIGDRTRLTIEETHHLSARGMEKKEKLGQSHHRHSLSSVFVLLPGHRHCTQSELHNPCSAATGGEEREALRLGSHVWQVRRIRMRSSSRQ
jgi:hypothetical protein